MSKPYVLFVDDEPRLTAGLKRALRREPYHIVTADSAAEALERMKEQAIDVVVTDEQMPGMPGSQLLGVVREKYPDTIRMVLTGQASLEAAIRAINEGEVYRYFQKPVDPVDLATTIRHALRQKALVEESARLLQVVQGQNDLIEEMERRTPGITAVARDDEGSIVLDEDALAVADIDDLIGRMTEQAGRWQPKKA